MELKSKERASIGSGSRGMDRQEWIRPDLSWWERGAMAGADWNEREPYGMKAAGGDRWERIGSEVDWKGMQWFGLAGLE